MAIKIMLDAGHYAKYNRSPCIKTYYESEMNWKLHNWLKYYLERLGITVYQTRHDQKKDMAVVERGKSSKGCDLLLSVHSNAVGSSANEKVDYPVAYVPLDGKGTALGKLLAECVEKMMGTKQEGQVQTRRGNNGDYYGIIRGATSVGVPCIILEHSFHTNTKATEWLLNDANLQDIAKAEAEIIASYFGLYKATDKSQANSQTVKCPKCGHSFVQGETPKQKSVDEIAKEVINGKWGNGEERKKRLTEAGYNYSTIQKKVNELCK
jgi:N-acetylmuramoyl-L-alanine amidase